MSTDEQPETISREDQAYLSAALAEYSAAAQALQEAQRRHQGAQGVMNFIQNILGSKYGLKPGDQVQDDGRIVRTKSE